MPAIRKILCPVDFSTVSTNAFEYARWLARRLEASIEVFHAIELPAYVAPEFGLGAGREVATLVEIAQQDAQKKIDAMLASVPAAERAQVTARVEMGTPSHAVISQVEKAAAEGQPFDLIVMGTTGRTGLAHLLLGSVAERVVRRALCPVLTIHAPPENVVRTETAKSEIHA